MDHPSLWMEFFSLFYIENVGTRFRTFIGEHTGTNNQFHWHYVQFNLPCTTGYDTILPRFWLISFDGYGVVRVIVLFDDVNVYGLGAEHVQSGLRHIFAGLQFIGNKEDARKRTDLGKRPQSWCGCCVYTDKDLIQKIIS